MKILDSNVNQDLLTGHPIRIELGSGGPGRTGYYGVDILPLPGIAIQADLNEPLDLLPDNCVEAVYSSHVMEHVADFMKLMRELHRIVRPGGTIETLVPHFSNPYYYSDPTHTRFFGLYTFYYFVAREKQPNRKVPCFYSDIRFSIERIHIKLLPRPLLAKIIHPKLSARINKSISKQDWWERTLCWRVPADTITYWMTPDK